MTELLLYAVVAASLWLIAVGVLELINMAFPSTRADRCSCRPQIGYVCTAERHRGEWDRC